ncbi:MAG TPA: DUF4157 domain-containing protein, partial [Chloroflexota bacterium]|nr:DUF4157 domain-containing protein [Chloroflexota bacterium]
MTMLAYLDQRRPANRIATPQRVKSGIIQRHCACGGTASPDSECAACRAMRLARRPDVSSGAADAIPPMVHDVLRSPGRPLDTASRAFFEPRFGRDFSRVRVHADAPAAASARALNALAYTVGRDLVFDTGQFAPETAAGRRLLAHELTHVVQQDAGDVAPLPRRVGDAHDDDEREANAAMVELSEETETLWPAIQPASRARGIVQRFSTSEHIEIGNRAYEQAHAQIQPPSGSPLTIDADFVKELYLPAESAPGVASPPSLRYQRAGGGPAQTYGQLVAAADDFASFEQMDQREQNKSGVPVLGRIWDFIADKSRYVALAAENY